MKMDSTDNTAKLPRLLLLILAVMIFLLIPLKVSSLGYFPEADVSRHVAHVVDGRPWSDVLVLRSDLRPEVDGHPGWHSYLAAAHCWLGLGPDALITLSFITTFAVFGWVGLAFSRRPLAWLGACGVLFLVNDGFFGRLFLGRPFAISMASLVAFLFWWSSNQRRTVLRDWIVSTLIIVVSVWTHPAVWYLWLGVIGCFAMARRWRDLAVSLGGLASALLLAVAITGSWYNIVSYPLIHLQNVVLEGNDYAAQLVAELQPLGVQSLPILVAAAILFLRHYPTRGRHLREALLDLNLLVVIVMWILGLRIVRFWIDWGIPAYAVWLTRQFTQLPALEPRRPWDCVIAAAALALPLYLGITADTGSRYTYYMRARMITDPPEKVQTLLPDKGGILYSAEMRHFFKLYYRFPKAEVRYILGFESGMMPNEDLQTLRAIQLAGDDIHSYEPWLKKMTPRDRIFINTTTRPEWPGMEFEWRYSTWVGRKVTSPTAQNKVN